VEMTNNSSLKKLVTKVKNKIIDWLHSADISQLLEVVKFIGIRISQDELARLEDKIKK